MKLYEHPKITRFYQMYNGFNNKLLEDSPIIEAKNGAEACRKLLDRMGIQYTKVVRDSSNLVKIAAKPFEYDKVGRKYQVGKVSWFRIYNGDSIY